MKSLFRCTVCGAPLTREEKTYRCPNGHSFDIAKEGYTYYQFPTDSTDSPTVVLGLPVKALLKEEAIPVDLRVSIPAHGVHVALSGTVEPVVNSLSAPADRIQDSDIESIVRLRQALEQIAGLVGSAIKAAQ